MYNGTELVPGDIIVKRDRQANLESLAARVLDVSSQYSRCGTECYRIQTCSNCTTSSFHADAVLKIDVYPRTADVGGAWEAVVPSSGEEYIELEFDDEVYVSLVNIYEVFNPGVVDGIFVASEYYGTIKFFVGVHPCA